LFLCLFIVYWVICLFVHLMFFVFQSIHLCLFFFIIFFNLLVNEHEYQKVNLFLELLGIDCLEEEFVLLSVLCLFVFKVYVCFLNIFFYHCLIQIDVAIIS